MNLPGFCFFGSGHRDENQPVLVFRADLVVVNFDRQRDGSHKFAGRPLLAMEHFGLDLARRPPFFARDSQVVTHDGEVQRVRIDSRRHRLNVDGVPPEKPREMP